MRGAKLAIAFTVVLPVAVLLSSLASATERCVLAELFTEEFCMDCAKAEAALDSVVKNDFTSAQLAVIRHWMQGELYVPEDSLRFFYYPETYHEMMGDWGHWTPTVWFDGVDEQTGVPFDADADSLRSIYREKIQTRRDIPSPLAMDLEVEYGAKSDTGTVHVEVVATDPIALAGLHLRMAIIENNLSIKMVHSQVLRDYFPDLAGISFSISEGDTFTHSQDFVIDTAWVDENCEIVAFVQDDTTQEVVQAVQGPVMAPIPAAVANLTITLAGEDLLLRWSAVTVDTNGHPLQADLYRVYRNTSPFFEPDSSLFDSTADTFYLDGSGVVGDTGTHYYYAVTAVSGGKQSEFSWLVGEFDKSLFFGK